jgi:hypothetical protein
MKPLDKQPETIFRGLTAGLTKVGDRRRIDGSTNIEVIGKTKLGPLVSIVQFEESHDENQARYTGVVFLISSLRAITGNLLEDADEYIYPISFRQDGSSRDAIAIKNGRWNVILKLQTTICCFANQWILNISDDC